MPHVYICTRCAEKIDDDTQDWVIVSMDTAGSSGLESRAHADCEVKRLKAIQLKSTQAASVHEPASSFRPKLESRDGGPLIDAASRNEQA